MSEKYLGENSTPILINQIKDKLLENYKVMGELGAKNLIPYPYVSGTSISQDGITYTANSDGSITINGTSSSDKYIHYYLMESNKNILPYGQYILSTKERLPQGVVIRIQHISDDSNIARLDNTMDSVEFTINDNTAQRLLVTVIPNTTVDNVTIYPMIRLASDIDDTWQPYAKTNRQLTNEVNNIKNIPIISGIGVKSIIEGDTAQNTSNGNYAHAEGTATQATGVSSHAEGQNTIALGNYSHAEGYSCTAQGQRSHAQNTGTLSQGYSQTAIGKYNVAQGTSTIARDDDYALIIGNGSGNNNRSNALAVQWNGNVVFQDNSTIKSAKTVYEVMGKMGAKNLISTPYYDVNTTNRNGITYTLNADGSITFSGTATDYSYYRFNTQLGNALKADTYTLSAHQTSNFPTNVGFVLYDGTTNTNVITIWNNDTENNAIITQEVLSHNLDIRLTIPNGTIINTPITVYPMLRLADDQDNTYQPYAMTNKELTDNKMSIADLKSLVASSSDFSDFQNKIAAL